MCSAAPETSATSATPRLAVSHAAVRPAIRPEVALVLLTLAAWGGVVLGVFHSDDFANVVRDPATRDLGVLPSRLLHGVRPLLRASYVMDHSLWGLHPAGFLLTNLLLHLTTVLGVHALARRSRTPHPPRYSPTSDNARTLKATNDGAARVLACRSSSLCPCPPIPMRVSSLPSSITSKSKKASRP